ncbi:CALX protein, partial [Atractosteus spatula]|nr:CALX protein [Atractosteus spatula]
MPGLVLALFLLVCVSATSREKSQIVYRPPEVLEDAHFAESFDSGPLEGRWVLSQAAREGEEEEEDTAVKYDGIWAVEEPVEKVLPGNRGLVLKSAGRHHAISAPLLRAFHFLDQPLIVQYEVQFQQGMDCGGAYIKLLSQSEQLNLTRFSDTTPYSIMFGPDKCGEDHKLHFIFRHRDPLTGRYEEKHARRPDWDLREYFTDRKAHLYTLRLYPDNSYEILIDQSVVSKGSLLEDMTPPVTPPREVPDPSDTKPADWDDRQRIPDPSAIKPADWDEEAPLQIPDPAAQKPPGWLEQEPDFIPDTLAQRPQDWDEQIDGEWEAPLVPNPACKDAIGCGPWTPPMISNPAYKGKWKPPMIDNPNYQGQWQPRLIPNPGYFKDPHPFRMAPLGAVGLELWAQTAGVLFDNLLVCADIRLARRWTRLTWEQRLSAERALAPGILVRLLSAAIQRPWLWGLYVFTVGLPIILFISFMWPDKSGRYPSSPLTRSASLLRPLNRLPSSFFWQLPDGGGVQLVQLRHHAVVLLLPLLLAQGRGADLQEPERINKQEPLWEITVLLCAVQNQCSERFGPPDQEYYYKKSDEPQPDDPLDSLGSHRSRTQGAGKPVGLWDGTSGMPSKTTPDPKPEVQAEGGDDSCVTFVLHEEDHTLGNALRYMVMKNPEVEFCGYSITHPSESKINFRIQTRERQLTVKLPPPSPSNRNVGPELAADPARWPPPAGFAGLGFASCEKTSVTQTKHETASLFQRTLPLSEKFISELAVNMLWSSRAGVEARCEERGRGLVGLCPEGLQALVRGVDLGFDGVFEWDSCADTWEAACVLSLIACFPSRGLSAAPAWGSEACGGKLCPGTRAPCHSSCGERGSLHTPGLRFSRAVPFPLTPGGMPAVEPFRQGLNELMEVCQHVLRTFEVRPYRPAPPFPSTPHPPTFLWSCLVF